VGGTRKDKVVLVQHSSIADPDTGASYTVKKYTSKINQAKDGTWQHEEIVLKPLNPEYEDIVIKNAEDANRLGYGNCFIVGPKCKTL